MTKEILLTVPAEPEYGLVLRMALSAIGAINGLSLDMIDDLKTALDEAFDLLTHQLRLVESVKLRCIPEENELKICLSAQRAMTKQDCTPVDPEVAHLIIGTLATKVNLEGDQCGIHSVHFSLPVGVQ